MRAFDKDEEERAVLSRVEGCGYPVLKAKRDLSI